MTGVTRSGFEYEINDKVLNDMRIYEALREVDAGNPLAITDVFTYMFGKEQKDAYYEHLVKVCGVADIEVAVKDFEAITDAQGGVKN